MFIFAIAHYYAFPHKPFVDPASPAPPCCASFASMWDVSDVRDDLVQHVRSVGSKVSGTVVRNARPDLTGTANSFETTPLLSGTDSSPSESADCPASDSLT